MSGRPMVGRPQPLRAFRLAEIPENITENGARLLTRQIADGLQPERFGGARLYGRPASTGERMLALDLAIEVTRRSLFPSDRQYRVSQEAWDEMIEKARPRVADA